MKVYKVVKRSERGDSFQSLFPQTLAKVEYKVGEWSEAPEFLRKKGYYLFAFRDLRSALLFISEILIWDVVLFEAEARGEKKLPPPLKLWKLETQGKTEVDMDAEWPPGTVMVERIKLIREVERVSNEKD